MTHKSSESGAVKRTTMFVSERCSVYLLYAMDRDTVPAWAARLRKLAWGLWLALSMPSACESRGEGDVFSDWRVGESGGEAGSGVWGKGMEMFALDALR